MVNFTALGVCNRTLEFETVGNEKPLFGSVTFHHLGLVLCAVFGLIAICLSLYLMFMHATHYHKPYEQKHIIRILFMVPIYSTVSFLSYLFYQHTIYFDALRDCYEAFVIASFFSLLCAYVAPNLHDQKEYFRTIQPKGWIWPLQWGKYKLVKKIPRSGLTWFNIIWFCIFQYCFIRVFMTFVAVITQATDRYCEDSLSPAFSHVWVTCIEGAAVSVAMYCVIQYYYQLRTDISEYSPLIKVLSIKGVIFFSFWQTLVIDFLVSAGALKPSATISYPDISIGIPNILLCIEMALFAVLHLFAYPWRVYDVKRSAIVASETVPGYDSSPQVQYHGGRFGYKAFLEAYNPWDIFKAVGRGARWMAVGRRYREQDISYKQNNMQGTALEDHPKGKQYGAYTKLDDPASREHSPDRRSYHQPGPYGGRSQAYGVTHPSHSRPGTSDGTNAPPPAAMYGSQHYDQAPPPMPPAATSYGVAGPQDTAYHGAADPHAPVSMPDVNQFK